MQFIQRICMRLQFLNTTDMFNCMSYVFFQNKETFQRLTFGDVVVDEWVSQRYFVKVNILKAEWLSTAYLSRTSSSVIRSGIGWELSGGERMDECVPNR